MAVDHRTCSMAETVTVKLSANVLMPTFAYTVDAMSERVTRTRVLMAMVATLYVVLCTEARLPLLLVGSDGGDALRVLYRQAAMVVTTLGDGAGRATYVCTPGPGAVRGVVDHGGRGWAAIGFLPRWRWSRLIWWSRCSPSTRWCRRIGAA